jgi:methyl-accepting chemotaxis protein
MEEVVLAIQQVADLMDSISAASSEQASGVSQIGEAVGHMDQTTQQNAALVEEMSAAAASLRARAHELVQSVAAFRLNKGGNSPLRQILLESAT